MKILYKFIDFSKLLLLFVNLILFDEVAEMTFPIECPYIAGVQSNIIKASHFPNYR